MKNMSAPFIFGGALMGVVGLVYGVASSQWGTALFFVIGIAVTYWFDPRRRR